MNWYPVTFCALWIVEEKSGNQLNVVGSSYERLMYIYNALQILAFPLCKIIFSENRPCSVLISSNNLRQELSNKISNERLPREDVEFTSHQTFEYFQILCKLMFCQFQKLFYSEHHCANI